ncbi:MAG: chemotaxis protein CheD [Thermoanaerobaculia bacterium]
MRVMAELAFGGSGVLEGEVWTFEADLGRRASEAPSWPLPASDDGGARLVGREDGGEEPQSVSSVRCDLKAGQVFCSVAPAEVTAYVDSGVAVCVWDPAIHVGGVQHFQLPECGDGKPTLPETGGWSVEKLLEGLLTLGCRLDNLQASLFGGAEEAEAGEPGNGDEERGWAGNRTARMAQAFLEEEGIPIVSRDIGGSKPRRVTFRTDEGTAAVKLF